MSKKDRHKAKLQMKNQENNSWGNFVLYSILALAVIFLGWSVIRPTGEKVDISPWVKGKTDSKVVVAEYSDLQCPACKRYVPIFEQIIDKYQDRVRFEFHHFPLISIHSNALSGAKAVEAAGKQGKFWEMHDYLYSHQSDWENRSNLGSVFADYAKEIDLDVDKFKLDYKDKAILKKINKQRARALALGLRGTPTIRINNKTIKTPSSVEAFSELLDKLLSEANKDASKSAINLQ